MHRKHISHNTKYNCFNKTIRKIYIDGGNQIILYLSDILTNYIEKKKTTFVI